MVMKCNSNQQRKRWAYVKLGFFIDSFTHCFLEPFQQEEKEVPEQAHVEATLV